MENIRIALWGNGSYGVFLKTAYDMLIPEGIEFVCYGTEKNEGKAIQNGLPVYDDQKINTCSNYFHSDSVLCLTGSGRNIHLGGRCFFDRTSE